VSDFYLVIDDPALRTSWDAFLEPRPEADLLQTWSWGEVAGARGERPVRLGVFRDGELVAVAQVLVRPAFAGRSVGYVPHGPVWRREDPEAEAILVAVLAGLRAVGIRERAILVKLDPRSVVEGDAARLEGLLRARGLRRSPFDLQARTTRLVPLNGGGEALRAGWDTKARSRVRRAAEAGVEVDFQREPDPAGIAALAELLGATAAAAGFRTHDEADLRRVAAALAPDDRWRLAVARHAGEVVGVAATPRLGDRAFYLYGAIRRGPEGGALFPSYAALAGAMEGLAADGVREIDLWGVVESDAEDGDPSWAGFSEFKRHFKGRPLAHPGTYDLVVARGWDALRARLEGLRAMAGRRGRR
jgi:lipid II:glycine glycyltransferase (peptidoglycan interpeptide bridge formation enzyme)